jgi:hypothetical protein
VSSSKGDHPVESYFIAFEDWSSYHEINNASKFAAWYLEQSFRHPDSHDHRSERIALWCALLLDRQCVLALEPAHAARLWPPVSMSERYDLQTGIRVVHETLPFSHDERVALSAPLPESAWALREGEIPELEDHEPELVMQWHEWLWVDEFGLPQTDPRALGPGLIMLEGCKRIASGLHEIMENPLFDP